MKISTSMVLVALLLSGCSGGALLPSAPTAHPALASATAPFEQGPAPLKTIAVTPVTPTFTGTPTLIYPRGTPTVSASPDLPGTGQSTATATMIAPEASTPDYGPFAKISLSGSQIYWGACEPSFIIVTAQLVPIDHVHGVLLFLRLASTTSTETTKWGGGAIMKDEGGGNFSYKLTAPAFNQYREYMRAWGQYQLVATDRNLQVIGRSGKFLHSLSVAPCG